MECFCIEDGGVMENHQNSAIAKWLEEQGFTCVSSDEWHRVGPWIFAWPDKMTYRYCPHYGVGCGKVIAGAHLSASEFKRIWNILCRAKRRMLKRPNWSARIKRR